MHQGANRAQTIRGCRLICVIVNCCNKSGEENQENTNCGGGAVHAGVGPQVEVKFHPSSCLPSTMLIHLAYVAYRLPKSYERSAVTAQPTISAVPVPTRHSPRPRVHARSTLTGLDCTSFSPHPQEHYDSKWMGTVSLGQNSRQARRLVNRASSAAET